jgi:hypothetical protein
MMISTVHEHATIIKYPQGLTVGELSKILANLDPSRIICFGEQETPAELLYIYVTDDKRIVIGAKSPEGRNLNDHK